MLYRKLGSSAWDVSVISFGAWQIGDRKFWGETVGEDADRTVGVAIDHGINLFDTAEVYGGGESEEVLGRALKSRRDGVYVASKVAVEHCTPEGVREACENSLRRLNMDHIDLYQIHWPCSYALFTEIYAVLEQLKTEGKIREVGVSNFGPRDLDAWMETASAVSNQLGYNLLFRAPEYEMIPACRSHGLGVLVYMPLMQGLLTNRYASIEDIPMQRRRTRHFAGNREGARHQQAGHEETLMDTLEDLRDFADAVNIPLASLALSWLIAQPGVTSVILGARNADQLEQNLCTALLDIGPAAIAQLNEFTFPLKVAMGPNCDMWETDALARIH